MTNLEYVFILSDRLSPQVIWARPKAMSTNGRNLFQPTEPGHVLADISEAIYPGNIS